MKALQEPGFETPENRLTFQHSSSEEMIRWLTTETRDERFIDNIYVEMCQRLRASGIPVGRSTLHFTTHHPQWLGARILWKTGMSTAEIITFDYGVEETSNYRNSPVNDIKDGVDVVRQSLGGEQKFAHAFYNELRNQGYTDYVAWPLRHTLGKTHVVSFASDRVGGFSEANIEYLESLLPAFALVTEIRLKNRITKTLLETYVGPHASGQILSGVTTRGSGVTVSAAILICDLRDFTMISDRWPRDDVIELLNDYFDAVCEPIERHGGEILKFMGDGLLAIFPLSHPNACQNLLSSIVEAQKAMQALNEKNLEIGHEVLSYGIGVHVGDVMYGNIGSRTRLDFTVIGPAVNIASRLEELTKTVKHPVLLSEAFVKMGCQDLGMVHVGPQNLRGLAEPVDVYALPSRQAIE